MKGFGFDLDGVLYDWHSSIYMYAKSMYNLKEESDIEFFRNMVDGKYTKNFIDTLMSYQPCYTNIVPNKKLVKLINTISKNFEIYYITSRWKNLEYVTSKWLEDYDFPQPYNLYMDEYKPDVIRKTFCKYYVDDMPKWGNKVLGITNFIYLKKRWHYQDNNLEEKSFLIIKNILELENKLDILV